MPISLRSLLVLHNSITHDTLEPAFKPRCAPSTSCTAVSACTPALSTATETVLCYHWHLLLAPALRIAALLPATSPCRTPCKLACAANRCNKLDSCCESFEHCVSCCLSPEHKPEERRKETPRAPNNKESGVWADTFEYCLAVCRTHGRSTSHENAYIGPRHHCFSKLGKPMVSLKCQGCCNC
jgi:hypothetical protein